MEYYEFRNVYRFTLSNVYICCLPICWNSHLPSKRQGGKHTDFYPKDYKCCHAKTFCSGKLTTQLKESSLKLLLSSFEVRGISKLKTQLTVKFRCSGNTLSQLELLPDINITLQYSRFCFCCLTTLPELFSIIKSTCHTVFWKQFWKCIQSHWQLCWESSCINSFMDLFHVSNRLWISFALCTVLEFLL